MNRLAIMAALLLVSSFANAGQGKAPPLFTFEGDIPNSGQSKCEGECAKMLKPLLVKDEVSDIFCGRYCVLCCWWDTPPTADAGVINRPDGTKQYTLHGKPLYVKDPASSNSDGMKDKAVPVEM